MFRNNTKHLHYLYVCHRCLILLQPSRAKSVGLHYPVHKLHILVAGPQVAVCTFPIPPCTPSLLVITLYRESGPIVNHTDAERERAAHFMHVHAKWLIFRSAESVCFTTSIMFVIFTNTVPVAQTQ